MALRAERNRDILRELGSYNFRHGTSAERSWHKRLSPGANFLTKNALKFSPTFSSLDFVGPKKNPAKFREISLKIKRPGEYILAPTAPQP